MSDGRLRGRPGRPIVSYAAVGCVHQCMCWRRLVAFDRVVERGSIAGTKPGAPLKAHIDRQEAAVRAHTALAQASKCCCREGLRRPDRVVQAKRSALTAPAIVAALSYHVTVTPCCRASPLIGLHVDGGEHRSRYLDRSTSVGGPGVSNVCTKSYYRTVNV